MTKDALIGLRTYRNVLSSGLRLAHIRTFYDFMKSWVSYSIWFNGKRMFSGIRDRNLAYNILKDMKATFNPEYVRLSTTYYSIEDDYEAKLDGFQTLSGKELKKKEVLGKKWQRKPSIVNGKGNVNVSALIYDNMAIDYVENRDGLNNTGAPTSKVLKSLSGTKVRVKGKLKFLDKKAVIDFPVDKIFLLSLESQRFFVIRALNSGNIEFVTELLRRHIKPVKVGVNRKYLRKFFPEVSANLLKEIIR